MSNILSHTAQLIVAILLLLCSYELVKGVVLCNNYPKLGGSRLSLSVCNNYVHVLVCNKHLIKPTNSRGYSVGLPTPASPH